MLEIAGSEGQKSTISIFISINDSIFWEYYVFVLFANLRR